MTRSKKLTLASWGVFLLSLGLFAFIVDDLLMACYYMFGFSSGMVLAVFFEDDR